MRMISAASPDAKSPDGQRRGYTVTIEYLIRAYSEREVEDIVTYQLRDNYFRCITCTIRCMEP